MFNFDQSLIDTYARVAGTVIFATVMAMFVMTAIHFQIFLQERILRWLRDKFDPPEPTQPKLYEAGDEPTDDSFTKGGGA